MNDYFKFGYAFITLSLFFVHAIIIFSSLCQIRMRGFVLYILTNLWFFPEFVEISATHEGNVVVFDASPDGVEGSQLESLSGLILTH